MISRRLFVGLAVAMFASGCAPKPQPGPKGDLAWAYPVGTTASWVPPAGDGPFTVPGRGRHFTKAQISDDQNPVDFRRVIEMLLIHDLVEVECGDTPLFDTVNVATQAAREEAAAHVVFGWLPADQGDRLLRYTNVRGVEPLRWYSFFQLKRRMASAVPLAA